MKISELIELYEIKKEEHGDKAYYYLSELLREAKEQHSRDFVGNAHEQSWRTFKGKNLEKLIEHIIGDEVHHLGLEVINGNSLERTHGCDIT